MDDFTLKIVIIVLCAAALFYFARRASGSEEIEAGSLPFPQSTTFPQSATAEGNAHQPASVTGREIPFPVGISDLPAQVGADSNLPRILDYSFQGIDLLKGPSDPTRFFDELIMELENADDGYRWRESFFVATPTGLLDAMAEDKTDTYWGDSTLIVTRYDLKTIIRAVLERYADAPAPTKSEINRRPPGTDFA